MKLTLCNNKIKLFKHLNQRQGPFFIYWIIHVIFISYLPIFSIDSHSVFD